MTLAINWWKQARERWHRARQLSRSERRLLLQSLFLLPLTGLGLRLLGLRRLHSFLSRRVPQKKAEADRGTPSQQARAVARMVAAAARRGPYRAGCLPESLVLWWLLHRRGIEGRLQFGVRKEGNQFGAHAWVEYEDCALNGEDSHRGFTPLHG